MTASRHLNMNQLKMFMSPLELRNEGLFTREGPASKKIDAAKYSGMYEDIKEHGVKKPIGLLLDSNKDNGRTHTDLVNGHHRFFSQEDIDEDRLMPVTFSNKEYEAMRAGEQHTFDFDNHGAPDEWNDSSGSLWRS